MKKNLLGLITALFLTTSCASLNPLEVLNPTKPSVEANLQVGKNNEQEKNNIKLQGSTTEYRQDAEKISNDQNYQADTIYNITKNLELWQILILIPIIGAALPSWSQYWIAMKVVVSDVWFGLFIKPLKDIVSIFKRST